MNALTGRVSAAEASISVQSGKIDLAATKTELTTAIDGIQVGGRNLLKNSDREVSAIGGREFVQFADLAPIFEEHGIDEVYSLSLDLKSSDISTRRAIQVYMQNGSGTKYGFVNTYVIVTKEYQRFKFEGLKPMLASPTETKAWLAFFGTYNTGNFPIIRRVKIEKGNKATDWTPAPEDVDKAISTVQANLTVEAGKITALTTKTTGHETQIGTLTSSYNGLNSTVTQIKNDTADIINQFKDPLFKTVSHTGIGKAGWTTKAETYGRSWKNNTGSRSYFWFASPTVQLKPGMEYQIKVLLSADVATDVEVGAADSGDRLKIRATPSPTWFVGTIKLSGSTQFSFWVDNGRTLNVRELYIYESSTGLTVQAFSALEQTLTGFKTTVQNTYAEKTTVTQLATKWQTTTDLANGHTSQITSMGASINLRLTKAQVADEILNDKTAIKGRETKNDSPQYYYDNYQLQKVREYKNITALGLTGNYSGLLETASQGVSSPWPTFKQTFYTSTYTYSRSAINGSTWGSWAKVVDSNNVLSQINLSEEGVLIQGKNIWLDGNTKIDNAVIKNSHIDTLVADKITAGTLDAANVNIINLNVANLTGNRTQFVESAWNTINGNLHVNAERLTYTYTDGSYLWLSKAGISYWQGGTGYYTNFLTDIFVVTGLNHDYESGPLWYQLPPIYRGKQFKCSVMLTDAYGIFSAPDYSSLAINRIVCTIDRPKIDYAGGWIPIIGYSRSINIKTGALKYHPIQVTLIVQY